MTHIFYFFKPTLWWFFQNNACGTKKVPFTTFEKNSRGSKKVPVTNVENQILRALSNATGTSSVSEFCNNTENIRLLCILSHLFKRHLNQCSTYCSIRVTRSLPPPLGYCPVFLRKRKKMRKRTKYFTKKYYLHCSMAQFFPSPNNTWTR